jgi:predicted site-specific integrase-resolvase
MGYYKTADIGTSNDSELRVEEVLERLPVPRDTLIKWLQSGELKGRRIAEHEGGWRVRAFDLEWFIHIRGLDTLERKL